MRYTSHISLNTCLIKFAAKKFLEAGDKVKITVMYRGREMARQDIGIETLNRVVEILNDFSKIDKQANLEGRRLSLILSPK